MAKILIISKYYYPFSGGIEEYARHIAEHAARHHDVTVLANNHVAGNSTEFINGVKVVRRHVHVHWKGQPVSLHVLHGVRLKDYDLVHFHSPNPFANAVFLMASLFSSEVPLVVTHHMDIFGRRILRKLCIPLLHTLVKRASVTIVTSRKNLEISKDLPKSGSYAVVPLGIEKSEYIIDDALRAEAMEWRGALSGNAPVVGFIGRHARYKGISVLMEALVLLPDVHAVIGGDGPYRAEAEQKALDLGLQDRVHFVGRLEHREKLKLLSMIDVFAFPSTEVTEAFGIAQMEAMLCGAPVVASDLPTGVTDVAIANRTALLAAPGDPAGLSQQIRRLIEDRELAKKLASAARMHVLENMTYSTISKRTLSVFEDAIAARPIAGKVSLA